MTHGITKYTLRALIGLMILPVCATAQDVTTRIVCWNDLLAKAAQVASPRAQARVQGPPMAEVYEAQPVPPNVSGGPLCSMGTDATAPSYGLRFEAEGGTGVSNSVPDTMGAIGSRHYLEVIQSQVGIYDRASGLRISSVEFRDFFFDSGSADPRVVFDHYRWRWIIVAFANDRLKLAISMTDDPTGCWFQVILNVGRGLDFPTLGINEDGIYVASRVFSGDTGASELWVFDKAPLMETPPRVGSIKNLKASTFATSVEQPAYTYGPGSTQWFARVGPPFVILHKLTGSASNPGLQFTGTVTVDPAPLTVPGASQAGTNKVLKTNDLRLHMAVFRADVDGGSLWLCHSVDVGGRVAARWYQIDPDAPSDERLIQCGTVSHPTLHLYYPSLMVNKDGDVAMAFSASDDETFVGAYYTGRRYTDPPGHMAPVRRMRDGGGPFTIGLTNVLRWGDYSYTTLDPLDETTFWTVQQIATEDPTRWSTWVGQLRHDMFDCNGNGRADEEDVDPRCFIDCSDDCDSNGIPDECQPDCTANGVPDRCEIEGGASDVNLNAVPDTCEEIDGDGDADHADVGLFIRCFGADITGEQPQCAPSDFDRDGHVGLDDFAFLAGHLSGPK